MNEGSRTVDIGDDWIVLDRAREGLAELGGVLRRAVSSGEPRLRDAALHLVERPGKRLRPALVFVAANGADGDGDGARLLQAAAGVELLHIGSLLHDDIMDRAGLRRGAPAASRLWGEPLAGVAGTYVTTAAIEMLAVDDDVVPLVAASLLELCSGQLQEAQNAFSLEMPLAEYVTIVARKTASLFELPCRVGATLARLPANQARALATYGRQLGVAFQMTDDLLDLRDRGADTGKALLTDLRSGMYGLPVVLALQRGDELARELAERLRAARGEDDDLSAVAELLEASGAIERAADIAAAHRDVALAALDELPAGPARESLARLASFATSRAL